MEWDDEKITDDVLALLYLTSFKEHDYHRAWKGHDWEVMNRLYDKDYITDPKNKNKSIVFTNEGFQRAKELCESKYKKSG